MQNLNNKISPNYYNVVLNKNKKSNKSYTTSTQVIDNITNKNIQNTNTIQSNINNIKLDNGFKKIKIYTFKQLNDDDIDSIYDNDSHRQVHYLTKSYLERINKRISNLNKSKNLSENDKNNISNMINDIEGLKWIIMMYDKSMKYLIK